MKTVTLDSELPGKLAGLKETVAIEANGETIAFVVPPSLYQSSEYDRIKSEFPLTEEELAHLRDKPIEQGRSLTEFWAEKGVYR